MNGNIVAAGGAPCTGKATSVFKMEADLKLAHPGKRIRPLTDLDQDCPYPLGRETTLQAQNLQGCCGRR